MELMRNKQVRDSRKGKEKRLASGDDGKCLVSLGILRAFLSHGLSLTSIWWRQALLSTLHVCF
jgi:hypothetical protein